MSGTSSKNEHDETYNNDNMAEAENRREIEELRKGLPAWRLKTLKIYICLCMIVNGYDISNVANIQASLYRAFGHVDTLSWVALNYSLLCTACPPLVSRLLDLGNIRFTVIYFFALFIVSCTVTGSAKSMTIVAVGRALTGVANTGIYQLNLSLVALLYEPDEATRLAGMVGVSWAVGLLLGPFIGGAFADNHHTTWRWAFYIVTPFLGTLMIMAFLLLPNYNPRRGISLQEAIQKIDWLGGVLHIGATVLFALAVVQSGSSWNWNSGAAIASWVIWGLVFIAYFAQQYTAFLTTPLRRIFPVIALKHRTAGLAALGVVCSGISYAISLYFLPLFFAFARGQTPEQAAVRIVPFTGVFIGSVISCGIAMPRVGYYAPFYVAAGIFIVVGGALMAQVTPTTHYGAITGFQALMGFGTGMIYANGYGVANAALDEPNAKLASAILFNITSLGGIALALAVAVCIYHNLGFKYLQSALRPFGFSDAQIRDALAGVDSPILRSDSPAVRELVVLNVTKTIAHLYYFVVAAGAVCIVVGLCMRWEKLDFKRSQKSDSDATDTTPPMMEETP